MAIHQRPDFVGNLADAQTFYTAAYNGYMLALKGMYEIHGRRSDPQVIAQLGDEVAYWAAQVLLLGGQIQPVAPNLQEVIAIMNDVTGGGGTVQNGNSGFFSR